MSLKSMTAFGSGEAKREGTIYRCEIRSLNSRFCDISFKMPRSLIALEPKLITRVKERILRGKVDVFLDLVPSDRTAGLPKVNSQAIEHYLQTSLQLSRSAGHELRPLSAYELLRLDGVLENQYASSSQDQILLHEAGVTEAIDKALSHNLVQRLSEGAALGKALLKLLDTMQFDREAIAAKREQIQLQVFDSYRKRLERLLHSLDDSGLKLRPLLPEERVLGELAMLAERADIEEELTRLGAHEEEFRRLLQSGDEVGRRTDFLCQEMHREVNTISNKLTHLDIAQHSMNLKQTVERLKQQVANIE